MKTLINFLAKGLASLLFVALLAVNVQVGSGNGLLGTGYSLIQDADAGPIVCWPRNTLCVDIPGEDYVLGIRIEDIGPGGPIQK